MIDLRYLNDTTMAASPQTVSSPLQLTMHNLCLSRLSVREASRAMFAKPFAYISVELACGALLCQRQLPSCLHHHRSFAILRATLRILQSNMAVGKTLIVAFPVVLAFGWYELVHQEVADPFLVSCFL